MLSLDNVGSLPHKSLLVLVWAGFGAATLFVALRTAIRCHVASRLTMEDYWTFLALATLLTLCILETVQLPSLYYMTAVIAGDIPFSDNLITVTVEYLRLEFPIIILFWTVLWSVKAGFLALYFKLFRELVLYRRVWYILAGFTFLAYVGCVITLCLSCHPISNFFLFAQCGNEEDIWASNLSVYYSTAVDVFTDLCIMAMPLRMIFGLKISFRQKAGLFCLFGLCFFMIAFAVIRAKQVLVPQYFVNLTLLMIWSTLAASVSLIVATLPTFKIFITNRASQRRAGYASFGSRQPQYSNNAELSCRGLPMGSLSGEKKSGDLQSPAASDSQEEILRGSGQFRILKEEEITIAYHNVDRPSSIYQKHQSNFVYGLAV